MKELKKYRFLIVCRKCGTLLLKIDNAVFGVLNGTMKCPGCNRLISLPEDMLMKPSLKKNLTKD